MELPLQLKVVGPSVKVQNEAFVPAQLLKRPAGPLGPNHIMAYNNTEQIQAVHPRRLCDRIRPCEAPSVSRRSGEPLVALSLSRDPVSTSRRRRRRRRVHRHFNCRRSRPRNGKVPEFFLSVRASPIDCYSCAHASMFWLDGFVDDSVILAPLVGGFVS